jgi:bifunctional DNase/RNase
VIAINGRSVEIDSRPSDAIALAVRTHSPIMVEDMVMERAGVSLEGEGEEGDEEGETPGEATGESTAAGVDEERLGVFRDFINTLDLDDFDRKRGS